MYAVHFSFYIRNFILFRKNYEMCFNTFFCIYSNPNVVYNPILYRRTRVKTASKPSRVKTFLKQLSVKKCKPFDISNTWIWFSLLFLKHYDFLSENLSEKILVFLIKQLSHFRNSSSWGNLLINRNPTFYFTTLKA